MNQVELSFITVNYKTPDLVDRLINSIHKYAPSRQYEIIVVDNGGEDNSVEILMKSHADDIRLLPLSKNLGFAGGNNEGAKLTSGNYIILINSDCELNAESFDKPVQYLTENPDVGIIGLKVITPEGDLEQSARGFLDPSTGLFGTSTFLGKLAQKFGKAGKGGVAGRNLMVDPSKTEPYDVDWVAGTIMVISRECWDIIRGFDDGFFMYWEDADLCYRAKEAGYRTVYYPGAQVIHRPGSSAKRDPAPAIRWFHDSAYRYFVKHTSPGPSLMRGFAWCALNLRASILIARARMKNR